MYHSQLWGSCYRDGNIVILAYAHDSTRILVDDKNLNCTEVQLISL